jgi:peptidoglycan/LPS O-acetylase OafA/YrhL
LDFKTGDGILIEHPKLSSAIRSNAFENVKSPHELLSDLRTERIGKALTVGNLTKRENNNFGFLRLLFAGLVILSHSPEMIDGNRSREMLTRIFGTLSFGEVAVDGFFLISGYLITRSWVQSSSTSEYLLKRVLRIYPGYIVAYLISLLVVGPLAGGQLNINLPFVVDQISTMISLGEPTLPGTFADLPNHLLNSSMWTIPCEFVCYLLVMALGMFGMMKHRMVYLAMTALVLTAVVVLQLIVIQHRISLASTGIVAACLAMVKFFAIFSCGGCFYLFSDKIQYKRSIVLVVTPILIALLFSRLLAEASLAVFGGYLLFSFAFGAKANVLSQVDNKFDLSYGLYLYAWPIQNLLIMHFRSISPWVLSGLALAASSLVAFMSWTFVEKPCMKLKSRFAQA